MEGYYATHHSYGPPLGNYPSGASLPSNTNQPEHRALLDTSIHPHLNEQYNYSHYRSPTQPPNLSNSLAGGFGPDPDFVQSLRSIRATQSSPGQGRSGGSNGPTQSEALVAETIVRARKSWKTVKGRNEPVWPPELEKVLVQALLSYRPDDAQFSRALGRFPKRNRYISDYIFATTGIRRTPKQVGSRLQQLKDVSCGKMLLNHVASWAQAPSSSSSEPSGDSGDTLAEESQLDYSAILNDVNEFASGSDGSQSPVTPLAVIDQGPPFSAASASPGVLHSYPGHTQNMYPQATWLAYERCLSQL
ncbi:hypothetical protein ACEPAH_7166 [Sanghuangporus vaninii]